jgi:predicted kinase
LTGFDCLEFEPEFRWIDVAEEIALLLMDMESRACLDHAHAFLSGYLAESGDYHAVTGLTLYKAHHGFVRAKVAAISAAQSAELARRAEWRRDCHRLLATAARALGQQQPLLLLTCGVSGSGKTWLARQLAARLRCLHLRSDVERKRLAGLKPSAKSHSALRAGLYGEEMTGAVYSRLADFAAAILSGGYSVIVDATFARRAERARFSQLAASLHVPLQLIECRAPEATLRARIAERRAMAGDASEADERVLDWQLQHFQPVSADENLPTTVVNTEAAGVVDALAANVRCLYEQH